MLHTRIDYRFEQCFKIVSNLAFYSKPESHPDWLLNLINNFLPENPNFILVYNCGKLTSDEINKIEYQEKNKHKNKNQFEDNSELK